MRHQPASYEILQAHQHTPSEVHTCVPKRSLVTGLSKTRLISKASQSFRVFRLQTCEASESPARVLFVEQLVLSTVLVRTRPTT